MWKSTRTLIIGLISNHSSIGGSADESLMMAGGGGGGGGGGGEGKQSTSKVPRRS